VSTRELAWGACTAGLRTPYDLVLASDLIYEQAQLPALADTLAALIAPAACGGGSAPRADSRAGAPPPSGRVLLAYEQRPLVVERAFAEFARAGLSAERVRPQAALVLALRPLLLHAPMLHACQLAVERVSGLWGRRCRPRTCTPSGRAPTFLSTGCA